MKNSVFLAPFREKHQKSKKARFVHLTLKLHPSPFYKIQLCEKCPRAVYIKALSVKTLAKSFH